MINIKNRSLALFIMMLIISVVSCREDDGFNTVISEDKTKPDVVTKVKVDNFNGGAYITYDLPNSPNILYVLAKYHISDEVLRETKSSYYKDTIIVNGFAKEQEYNVTLYTVTRANVMSDSIIVKVNPQRPVYQIVQPTISLSADFGGINIKAKNSLKKEIGVIVTAYNEQTQAMEVEDQYFTKAEDINYSIRGYESLPRNFGVYITDQWGNISDTLKANITPLYEELLDKNKFSVYNLPSDAPIGYGWQLPNLWDNKIDGDGWHTEDGVKAPFVCTFNIGNTYKLSRFVLWERTGEYTYGHGNPKEFSLWGSNSNQPHDEKLPLVAEEGTVIVDWVNLGNYNFPDPPSGLAPNGLTNAADEAFVKAGVSFDVPFNAPSVKFLRLAVAKTWSGGTSTHVMEISLYGTPE